MNQTLDLAVTGMSCAACVRRVERALLQVPGTEAAEVNLVRGTARVRGRKLSPEPLIAALRGAGYDASPNPQPPPPEPLPWLPLLLAAPLLINMALMRMDSRFMLTGEPQAVLALAVMIAGGSGFHRRAFAALRHGTATMDVLVVLGSDAAFGLSLARLIANPRGMDLYFESAALIVAFVRLGRFLESRARRKAAGALEALLALRPATARKITLDGTIDIPASELLPGDRIALRPGERCPADAVLDQGEAQFDLALLTGESLPAAQTPGAHIPEGAINLDGDLRLSVTAVGQGTKLARIVRLVTDAQAAKPPLQNRLDRISAVFVPAVIGLAILTFVLWWLLGAPAGSALIDAIAVLVVACPCALGLAAPVAMMAGTGVAARHGILIRDPAALENAARVNHVAFDKTGTLTAGKPSLAAIAGDETAALMVATALARGSEHALAHAILARGANAPACRNFHAIPGRGVRGTIEGAVCVMGNAALMAAETITTAPLQSEAASLAASGHSLVYVARDGVPLGLLAFTDQPRPEAKAAVSMLQSLGIGVTMLTGDNRPAAAAIAAPLGITDIAADLLPQDKLARIQALNPVAMVGDGINDAPALAAADLGMAMGSGSDLAIESAPITLMHPDPLLVPAAIDIARRTRAAIHQGLAWALIYNLVALPLAATGHLTPLVAGIAMAFSSLSVVLNALRLNFWRPRAGNETPRSPERDAHRAPVFRPHSAT